MTAAFPRARKLTRILLPTLAAALLAFGPGLAQEGSGPAFPYPQGFKAEPGCAPCHEAEPWEPRVLLEAPAEVVAGSSFEVRLTVAHAWGAAAKPPEYRALHGGIALPLAGEAPPPERVEQTGTVAQKVLNQPTPVARVPLTVDPAVTEIVATVTVPAGPGEMNRADLRLMGPRGIPCVPQCWTESSTPTSDPTTPWVARVKVREGALREGGPGTWNAEVRVPQGLGRDAPFTLTVDLYRNGTSAEATVTGGPQLLPPGETTTFTFTLEAPREPGPMTLYAAGILDQFYQHKDGTTQNLASFQVPAQATVLVGDRFVPYSGPGVVVPVAECALLCPAESKALAEVLGYASTFLLLPSLVMGGTFGKGSVTFFNRVLGAARRRVLWHNSMSFMLLGVSLVHMVLFLLEPRYAWDVGLLWGGLSLACMIGLGITGAMQRKLVKDWGFGTWRFVHFGLAALVVGFVLLHVVLDGAHFDAVRAALDA